MENINGKSRAGFLWVPSCATIGLAVSTSLCFAQENRDASQETETILVAIIAAISAMAAVVGAVVANRSSRVAMKNAYASMMSAQKRDGGALVMVPPAIGIVNKKTDWARTFIEAVETPFGTVVTILFSLALGVGLNILLPPSDSPSARAPASTAPATTSRAAVSAPPAPTPTVPATASRVAVSAPPAPTSTAPATASRTAVSAPPPPTSTASASDRDEVAALFARGRATLSTGDVAAARVLLRRAAEHGDSQAAVALGETYDPAVLKRLGIIKFNPDLAQAREWYRRAADLGSVVAAMRLDQPSNLCKQDEERLTRLRASLERDEVVRFERELGCERLRPQVVRLRESISAEEEHGDREARQQPQAEERRPTAGAEMQKPERDASVRGARSPIPHEQICKHDGERLARLRASLERDEVIRFEYELGCERLRPQVVRLRESLGAN
jgi:hypothetical protein